VWLLLLTTCRLCPLRPGALLQPTPAAATVPVTLHRSCHDHCSSSRAPGLLLSLLPAHRCVLVQRGAGCLRGSR
jgi:hypothetical protein